MQSWDVAPNHDMFNRLTLNSFDHEWRCKRLGNVVTQCESHSALDIYDVTKIWSIDDVQQNEVVQSDQFAPWQNTKLRFWLKMNPYGENEAGENKCSIYLLMEPFERDVTINFEINLLGENVEILGMFCFSCKL